MMDNHYSSITDTYWRYETSGTFSTPGRVGFRSVIGPSQIADPSVGFSGMDLIGQLNKFMAMKVTIDEVALGVSEQKIFNQVNQQLSAGQTVDVILNLKGDKATLQGIVRPGQAYLYDPEKTLVRRLEGVAQEICSIPGKEMENAEFEIKDSEGSKKFMLSDTDDRNQQELQNNTEFDNSDNMELP